MPELKTPTATGTSENGNGNGLRTLNGVNYALDALKELCNVRFDGMDKAISIAHADLVRVPTDVEKAVAALKDVISETFKTVDEKFSSVQKQFEERDTRATEKAELIQKALDAALLTAEKAVGKQSEAFSAATAKSEAAATKQIDAIGGQVKSVETNLNDKHTFAMNQIARLDNLFVAMAANRDGRTGQSSDMWGKLVGAAIVGGGVIGLIEFLSHVGK